MVLCHAVTVNVSFMNALSLRLNLMLYAYVMRGGREGSIELNPRSHLTLLSTVWYRQNDGIEKGSAFDPLLTVVLTIELETGILSNHKSGHILYQL